MTTHLFTAKGSICTVIMTIILILVPTGSVNFSPFSAQVAYSTEGEPRITSTNNSDLVILSVTTKYDQDLSAFHVFGEIMNNLTDSVISDIKLNVTFYDSSGNEVDTAYGNPFIETLRPLEKSAFDSFVYGDLARIVEDFSYYKVSKSWLVVKDAKPGLLSLQVDHMTIDSCGYYHIGGIVGNLGPELTTGFVISGSFYNERDQIVTSTITTPATKSIKAGAFAPYEFVIDGEGTLPHFAYFSLNAQSSNYASKLDNQLSQLSSFDIGIGEVGNSSAATPAHGSTPRMAKSNITVFADSSTYRSDTTQVKVLGEIADYHYNSRVEPPIVLMKIISGSGEEIYKATTTLSEDGRFSKIMDFHNTDGSSAQIYRIRAEYDERIAENTFTVESSNYDVIGDSNNTTSLEKCKDGFSKIAIQHLIVSSNDADNSDQVYYDPPQNSMKQISEVKAYSQVTLSVIAENKFSRLQPVVTVVEVVDSGGNAVFLHLQDNTILPNSIYQINVPWTPEDIGEYHVKSFAISGLEEPIILSTPVTTSLNVTY